MTHSIAIVGLGKIARDQHMPAIEGNAAFQLAATASRNAELSGVPSYKTLAELLEAEPDIGCISLCTPPQARYSDARLALQAGRHVMLEKPPGATLAEVHDLIALAEAQGVSLFATWHSRHAAAVDATRAWLADKTIRRVHIAWKEDVREWHPGQEWIWEAGGLGVFDPGINALSILTKILPRPVHLSGADLSFPENRDTPIAADLAFFDPDGAEVSASFDWREVGPPHWQITLETDEATAVLSEGGARLTVGDDVVAQGPDGEYPALYARFAALLEAQGCDVDLAPMRLVADAFTLGKRLTVPAFTW